MIWLLGCGSPAPTAVDPCVAAWREMADDEQAMSPVGGKGPSEAEFMEACAMLPAPARACLSPSAQIRDPSCRATLDAVPGDVRKRVTRRLAAP